MKRTTTLLAATALSMLWPGATRAQAPTLQEVARVA